MTAPVSAFFPGRVQETAKIQYCLQILKTSLCSAYRGNKKLLVRADSGFFDDKLMSEIESHPKFTYFDQGQTEKFEALKEFPAVD